MKQEKKNRGHKLNRSVTVILDMDSLFSYFSFHELQSLCDSLPLSGCALGERICLGCSRTVLQDHIHSFKPAHANTCTFKHANIHLSYENSSCSPNSCYNSRTLWDLNIQSIKIFN